MARYKHYSYKQGRLIPVYFEKQILPGTFEYTLNRLIDSELDLSSSIPATEMTRKGLQLLIQGFCSK